MPVPFQSFKLPHLVFTQYNLVLTLTSKLLLIPQSRLSGSVFNLPNMGSFPLPNMKMTRQLVKTLDVVLTSRQLIIYF